MKKIILSLILGFAAAAISGMAVSVSEKEQKSFSFQEKDYSVEIQQQDDGTMNLEINGETFEAVEEGDVVVVNGAEVEVNNVKAPWLFRNEYKLDLKVKESEKELEGELDGGIEKNSIYPISTINYLGILDMFNNAKYYGGTLDEGQSCNDICENPSLWGQSGPSGTCILSEFGVADFSSYAKSFVRCGFSEAGRDLTCVCASIPNGGDLEYSDVGLTSTNQIKVRDIYVDKIHELFSGQKINFVDKVSFEEGFEVNTINNPLVEELKIKGKIIKLIANPGQNDSKITLQANHIFQSSQGNMDLQADNSLHIYSGGGVNINTANQDDDATLYLAGDNIKIYTHSENPNNGIYFTNLVGTGNAYACLDSSGKLYRSENPCNSNAIESIETVENNLN